MNKEITTHELADALLELGKKKHGNDMKYAFAYGSLQGLFEAARWGFTPIQKIVNDKYAEVQKDLAAQ